MRLEDSEGGEIDKVSLGDPLGVGEREAEGEAGESDRETEAVPEAVVVGDRLRD